MHLRYMTKEIEKNGHSQSPQERSGPRERIRDVWAYNFAEEVVLMANVLEKYRCITIVRTIEAISRTPSFQGSPSATKRRYRVARLSD